MASPPPPPSSDHSSEPARLAGLLADRTRAAFCLALLDGRAWTVAELAGYAQVAPSTASEHLTPDGTRALRELLGIDGAAAGLV